MSTDHSTAFSLRLDVELTKASRALEEHSAAVRRFKAICGRGSGEAVMPEFEGCATAAATWRRIGAEVDLLTPYKLRTIMAALRQLAVNSELNAVDVVITRRYAEKRLLTSREAALGRRIVLHYRGMIARQFIEVIEES